MSAPPPSSRGAADADAAPEQPAGSEEARPAAGASPEPRRPARASRRGTSAAGGDTPMLRQYAAVKARHRDALLLFRMGDFYELFHEDARVAARALNITLTARGRGTPNEAPMCGVPHHALDAYTARLVRLGHKVAICDQVERPGPGRKLLRREVTRVITPGTLADPQQLEARAPHFLGAMCRSAAWTGVATVDLSTGHFRAARLASDPRDVWDFLNRISVRELIHPAEQAPPPPGTDMPSPPLSPVADWAFGLQAATQALNDHFGTQSLAGFGLEDMPEAVRAAGALLHYLRETQKSALRHIDHLALHDEGAHVALDEATRRNLEIIDSLHGTRGETLLGIMDEAVTAQGARLLREWLLQPLRDAAQIEERLQAVSEMNGESSRRQRLRKKLRGIHDLERLLGRAALGSAHTRDLLSLRDSLACLPELRSQLEGTKASQVASAREAIDPMHDLRERITAALCDEPPINLREGGLLRDGYDAEVDELRRTQRDARGTLAAMEARERQRTGISSLKVRYNRVFGYYIEVSRSNLDRVPSDYERRQTLTGAERFITPELKRYEEKILNAEERLHELEYERFAELREQVVNQAACLRATAQAVAQVDVLTGLAELAARRGYCRPTVGAGGRIEISEGRHPIVEVLRPEDPFVPNDTRLDRDAEQILILTGPNMGGKSTYLRQVALIVLMAQTGSFVPASAARIGVVDKIFCRVGASDNLAQGQSTFLVEMQETANILHNATPDSLVLLDEVGRGTSTFDGLSLAWAVVEYLHEQARVQAMTLFATHYHELTDLARLCPRVRNYRLSVREWKDQVVFLRRVEAGSSDRSYGIQVARLAGVPADLIERAREVLRNLESQEYTPEGLPRAGRSARRRTAQRALPLLIEEEATDPILERLRGLEPEHLTPLEALALLDELVRESRTRGKSRSE